jgi:molybdopterin molybdotransferase
MQVAIRPAKPFAFGILAGSDTKVFGLPGNPVSAMVSFELFVRPALRILSGHHSLYRPIVSAIAAHDLSRHSDGKLHLLRAKVTLDGQGTWRVSTTEAQESHHLHAMAEANALVLLPDGTGVPEAGRVDVLLLDPQSLGADAGGPMNPLGLQLTADRP